MNHLEELSPHTPIQSQSKRWSAALASVARLVGASSHKPRDRMFNFQSGCMSGMQAWSLVRVSAGGCRWVFLSHQRFSPPLSPSLPLWACPQVRIKKKLSAFWICIPIKTLFSFIIQGKVFSEGSLRNSFGSKSPVSLSPTTVLFPDLRSPWRKSKGEGSQQCQGWQPLQGVVTQLGNSQLCLQSWRHFLKNQLVQQLLSNENLNSVHQLKKINVSHVVFQMRRSHLSFFTYKEVIQLIFSKTLSFFHFWLEKMKALFWPQWN